MDSPTPTTTRVLLVRHGQSEWNADGRWQGQADSPLSDLGRRQAREAARAIGAVDAIWSSDLQRAAVTWAAVRGAFEPAVILIMPTTVRRQAAPACAAAGRQRPHLRQP